MWWSALTGKLENATVLDRPANLVAGLVNRVLPPGPAKDALHGRWLGHQLHPLLVALPIGMFSSVLVLDLVGGNGAREAARRLAGAGVLTVVPTAATGIADWSALGQHHRPRRVGSVHAWANSAATMLFLGSWLARRRGRDDRGRLLALAGSLALGVGGYLGGHLTYAQGVGVNRNADRDAQPLEWTDAAAVADISDDRPHLAHVDGQPVLLTRHDGELYAIAAICSHYGGPLHLGTIANAPDLCVVCPWHGSRFRLSDGTVARGPATTPELSYECRVEGDRVRVRVRT